MQYNLGQQSLAQNESQFQQTQQNEAPWIAAGTGALSSLGNLTSQGAQGTGPLAPWTQQFTPPSASDLNNPNNPYGQAYQFQLQQGTQALQNSAAARGGLLSGGTAKALDQYGQGLASTNYQQYYNNAFQNYQQSYNQFEQNQANTFNRLASIAGLGQTSVGQLAGAGQAASNTNASILGNIGSEMGGSLGAAAAANASGYTALGSGVSSGLNNLGGYLEYQNLFGPNGTLGAGYNVGTSAAGLAGYNPTTGIYEG